MMHEIDLGPQDDGECDVTDCTEPAVKVIVGEAGDLWLCAAHSDGGGADD